ncbi:hypothetical protein HNP11_003581 [Tsukamurella ocularis]|nr:hypothetical protein [Tsukamurella ocularis]MCS3789389.1 hypothetical protein [Tsukamurella ocularis]MCS3851371.1 hypothetical protein [Tsukamurella ocularis]
MTTQRKIVAATAALAAAAGIAAAVPNGDQVSYEPAL